ncbi:glycosyltransferase family 2 protein [Geodermatophilus sp. SYSU D00684]
MAIRDGASAPPQYPYDAYSTLAGPLGEAGEGYTVQFERLVRRDRRRGRALVISAAAIVLELLFLVWLLRPAHWPADTGGWTWYLSLTMVVTIGLIEVLRLVNVVTLALATWNAHDPLPVRPETGTRLALLTTIVPGKEPVEMVETTLRAALRVRHDGPLDVWLLDEGDDDGIRAMCARLGVRHFSRRGVAAWNTESGTHKRRTKHGNYNAWLARHGEEYDFWISVDTDHAPLPNIAERLMGYFRDPDVAFVVGPQVYGNYDNFTTRAAESQQYLFHAVLQRAGNRSTSAMFVGTNNAVRLSALADVGGLADSITEDAATSLVLHSSRNPDTGRRWKSVYTPDVLAVGEGPTSWSDYFVQQNRWARGTDEVLLRQFWRRVRRLSPARALHYGLLMSYYPSAAVSWVLGSANLCLYLVTGVGGVVVAANLWAVLYVNAAALQVGVYFWNRRYNVSPHEEEGSSGLAGMFVSVLSAPVYVTALADAVRGRNVPFAVTPKGDDSNPDRLATFRKNLAWGGVLAAALLASVPLGHDHPAMRGWALLALFTCLLPVLIWAAQRRRPRPAAAAPRPATAPRTVRFSGNTVAPAPPLPAEQQLVTTGTRGEQR